MATSLDHIVRTILQRTPSDEDPKDSMVLIGTLTLAYLAFPRWQLQDALDFERLAEQAAKIWCLLTDVTKTQAYRDGMREARQSYRGISRSPSLQAELRGLLNNLLESGELQSIRQAVQNQIYERMMIGIAF